MTFEQYWQDSWVNIIGRDLKDQCEIVWAAANARSEQSDALKAELVDALGKAHNCATLAADGTCEGCFVSGALKKARGEA